MASDTTKGLLPSPASGGLDLKTVLAQLVAAYIITLPAVLYAPYRYPGQSGLADLPGTVNLHWLVHQFGLVGAAHSRMLMYPNVIDRLVIDGFPLDALFSWPFTAVLGWPAGFTVFVTMCCFALGCATAWFARIWWGDIRVGVVAGIVAQTNPFLIRELVDGRPTQIFGAIFLPLVLGFGLRALNSGRRTDGLLAGACLGLSALAYWYYAVFFALALGLLLLVAAMDRRKVVWPALHIAGGTTAVALAPILYTVSAMKHMPGADIRWNEVVNHGGSPVSLMDLLSMRSVQNTALIEGSVVLQLLCFSLCAVALIRCARRHWFVPLLWGIVGMLFALGPSVEFFGESPLGLPYGLFGVVPGLRRLWWPDRFLVLAMPMMALLAGGGWVWLSDRFRDRVSPRFVPWLSQLGGVLLLVEAFLVIPGLPLPTTPSTPSAAAKLMGQESGPALILPLGSGEMQPDARMLLDQVHHGRPLVNGPMPPMGSTAPRAYHEFAKSDGLRFLHGCEQENEVPPDIASSVVHSRLSSYGISTVYLDIAQTGRLLVDAREYRACIERILNTAEVDQGPVWVYRVRS